MKNIVEEINFFFIVFSLISNYSYRFEAGLKACYDDVIFTRVLFT